MKGLRRFHVMKNIFNRVSVLTSVLYKVFQRAIIIGRIHNLHSMLETQTSITDLMETE